VAVAVVAVVVAVAVAVAVLAPALLLGCDIEKALDLAVEHVENPVKPSRVFSLFPEKAGKTLFLLT
jgi:hypothetical protein